MEVLQGKGVVKMLSAIKLDELCVWDLFNKTSAMNSDDVRLLYGKSSESCLQPVAIFLYIRLGQDTEKYGSEIDKGGNARFDSTRFFYVWT